MTGGTPFVEVWGYDYPCTQCQCALTWVSGLRPWYRARGRRTGHPRQALAVDVARDILERDGRRDLASQLRPPRPVGARGQALTRTYGAFPC
jgi:hypothetical protein